jgi:hypothetical protein
VCEISSQRRADAARATGDHDDSSTEVQSHVLHVPVIVGLTAELCVVTSGARVARPARRPHHDSESGQ